MDKSFDLDDLLRKSIVAIFLLNVVDGLLTLLWVGMGIAQEANPLMDLLIGFHPAIFMSGKLALVALGIALLWRHLRLGVTVVAIFLLLLVYYSLLLYHLSFASQLLV